MTREEAARWIWRQQHQQSMPDEPGPADPAVPLSRTLPAMSTDALADFMRPPVKGKPEPEQEAP